MGLAAALCDNTADKTRLVDHTEAVLLEVLGMTTVAAEADVVGRSVAAAEPTTGSARTTLP